MTPPQHKALRSFFAITLSACAATPAARPSAGAPPAAIDRAYDVLASDAEAECWANETPTTLDQLDAGHEAGNVCLAHGLAARMAIARVARGEESSATAQKEDATFDAFREDFEELIARRARFDVLEGGRHAGALGCTTTALEERIAYATWLGRGDAQALAIHVSAAAPRAAATRAEMRRIATLEANDSHPLPDPKHRRTLSAVAVELEQLARELSASSCTSFPGLVSALGGQDRCSTEMTSYFLAHCKVETQSEPAEDSHP